MGHGFKISKKRKSKKDNSINTQKLILSNLKPLTNNFINIIAVCVQKVPNVGLEPTTTSLKGWRSTN